MQSFMSTAAVRPSDLLLGLGGVATSPRGDKAPDGGFNHLLGLFPQLGQESLTAELAATGVAPNGMPQMPPGMMMVMLPMQLAQQMGVPPEMMPQGPPPEGMPDNAVMLPVQILPDPTDPGRMLLRLPLPSAETSLENQSRAGFESKQAMDLPVMFRTVENDGTRLSLMGVLQTATGEQTDIRIVMPSLNNMAMGGNQQAMQNSTTPLPQQAQQQSVDLPSLLTKVGATQVIIEPLGSGFAEAVAVDTTFPRAHFRSLSGGPMMPQQGNGTVGPAANPNATGAVDPIIAVKATPQTELVMPEAQSGPNHGLTEEFLKADAEKFNQALAAGSKTATAELNTLGLGSETLSRLDSAGNRLEQQMQQPVRFYDLDNKLEVLKQNPGQKIRIQLVPAELGRMELSIAANRGVVTVNVMLDSPAAKQAVERNIGRLESQLASHGIRVDNVTIGVNNSGRGESFSSQYTPYQQHNGGGYQQGGAYQRHQQFHRWQQMADIGPTDDFSRIMVNYLA